LKRNLGHNDLLAFHALLIGHEVAAKNPYREATHSPYYATKGIVLLVGVCVPVDAEISADNHDTGLLHHHGLSRHLDVSGLGDALWMGGVRIDVLGLVVGGRRVVLLLIHGRRERGNRSCDEASSTSPRFIAPKLVLNVSCREYSYQSAHSLLVPFLLRNPKVVSVFHYICKNGAS